MFIASDHAGYQLKEYLKSHMPNIKWVDCGPFDTARVDYPDYADRLVAKVLERNSSSGKKATGVLICGSGQGMAIRANRFKGIRAGLAWNEESVRLSRQHNDANILCLGARFTQPELAKKLVELFNATEFEGGRHTGRVEKLER
jgi:ribose 5-phosphate isomerase B